MFFTKVGRVIAWLIVIPAGLYLAMAFTFAFMSHGDDEMMRALAARYLSASTTGEAIGRTGPIFLIGLMVGMVAEISKSVAARSEVKEREPS